MTKSDKRGSKTAADLNKQFKHARRRMLVSGALAAVALIVGIQHLVAHAGWRPIPIGMGVQDLLIGYPVAGLIGLAALFVWGSTPSRN